MAEELLNGLGPLPASVIRRATGQGMTWALDLLAGVLAEDREDQVAGRPVELLIPLGMT